MVGSNRSPGIVEFTDFIPWYLACFAGEDGSPLAPWLYTQVSKNMLSRSTPHPVTVTTRIITFLVGNPYKPSFATVTGWGVDPKNTVCKNVPTLLSLIFGWGVKNCKLQFLFGGCT